MGRANTTINASFQTLYLGKSKDLLNVLKQSFPELGIKSSDCAEMSWIQSALFFADFPPNGPVSLLLNRTQITTRFFKAKSDFVTEPISETGLKGIWNRLYEAEEPHIYATFGFVDINWMRRFYRYMAPYVSKSPRAAYINYRDLDLGQSRNSTASYAQARAWGVKYFNKTFERLVQVKSKFDPDNFFRNEQSIPVVPA
ncbi:hypothetical protein Sjap_024694 [Stephania japonica]|uniref:Berberine/berberine-like domain-containing protein n=1 Tax=Stephania japonica TaxID=461633 RepID=A0AAP0EIQ9_9MAGN